MPNEDQELEALAREIARDRGCSLRIARKAAREQLRSLHHIAQTWNESSKRQRPQQPPTA